MSRLTLEEFQRLRGQRMSLDQIARQFDVPLKEVRILSEDVQFAKQKKHIDADKARAMFLSGIPDDECARHFGVSLRAYREFRVDLGLVRVPSRQSIYDPSEDIAWLKVVRENEKRQSGYVPSASSLEGIF